MSDDDFHVDVGDVCVNGSQDGWIVLEQGSERISLNVEEVPALVDALLAAAKA